MYLDAPNGYRYETLTYGSRRKCSASFTNFRQSMPDLGPLAGPLRCYPLLRTPAECTSKI